MQTPMTFSFLSDFFVLGFDCSCGVVSARETLYLLLLFILFFSASGVGENIGKQPQAGVVGGSEDPEGKSLFERIKDYLKKHQKVVIGLTLGSLVVVGLSYYCYKSVQIDLSDTLESGDLLQHLSTVHRYSTQKGTQDPLMAVLLREKFDIMYRMFLTQYICLYKELVPFMEAGIPITCEDIFAESHRNVIRCWPELQENVTELGSHVLKQAIWLEFHKFSYYGGDSSAFVNWNYFVTQGLTEDEVEAFGTFVNKVVQAQAQAGSPVR